MKLGGMVVGLLLTSGLVATARAKADVREDDDNQFLEDVIVCEEAVAHAVECCRFRVQGDACHYYEYFAVDSCGCGGGDSGTDQKRVRPVVGASEGHRIADLGCGAMNEIGPDGTTECSRLHVVLEKENASESHSAKKCL
jgi:hypothetical protein